MSRTAATALACLATLATLLPTHLPAAGPADASISSCGCEVTMTSCCCNPQAARSADLCAEPPADAPTPPLVADVSCGGETSVPITMSPTPPSPVLLAERSVTIPEGQRTRMTPSRGTHPKEAPLAPPVPPPRIPRA